MTLQDAQEEPLVRAKIDRAAVGDNWPKGIVQLIEYHEKIHMRMVVRKEIHVLIDRYVATYFPDVTIEYPDRRFIIGLLRERYYFRFDRHMTDLMIAHGA